MRGKPYLRVERTQTPNPNGAGTPLPEAQPLWVRATAGGQGEGRAVLQSGVDPNFKPGRCRHTPPRSYTPSGYEPQLLIMIGML